MSEAEAAGVERRRLLWRCRRGMKELDVLLERYTQSFEAPASAEERGVFARLLELPDPELAGYLLGGDVPRDPEMASLVRRISCRSAASGAGD
jgi:antitoxin CptB